MRFIERIKTIAKKLYAQADWYFRKKQYREFVVTNCLAMPTLRGMKTFGQVGINKTAIFVSEGAKAEGYRTLKPLMIRKIDRDDFQVYTEHLHFDLRRIK